jgi:ribosomal protein S18 acetylase RimI-like enzyme
MNIRNATLNDLASIYEIETACFPTNQAASLKTLSDRLHIFPHHFWLIGDNAKVTGFINGMVTDNDTVQDQMFKNANLPTENGIWQSVFGLAVLPAYQNNGYAGKLINHLINVSKQHNRKGIILTCEKHLISYYHKFGFVNIGLSASVHGGDVFFDMKKVL